MIPNAFIQAWRSSAPWPDARQVEQDLIICRALCDEGAAIRAFERVWTELIARIEGEPWKLTNKALDELRIRHPGLLQQ